MEVYGDQGTWVPCLPATMLLPWEIPLTHVNLFPHLPSQDKEMQPTAMRGGLCEILY